MSQIMNLGNRVKPLRNVAALNALIERVNNRAFGLPGMAVFYGPPGFGKTFACIHAKVQQDAIHISIQKLWTVKTLLKETLRELSIVPAKTQAEMLKQVNQGLAIADRPLIIDEADYAIERGMIEVIRDFHDGSDVPVIMIGMEKFPQKLQAFELVDSRVLSWVGAEPSNLRDTRLLAQNYADGLEIDDTMLEHIISTCAGNARLISKDLAYLVETCRTEGVSSITLKEWGNRPLFQSRAPAPRRGLNEHV
ncbi:AAA family ATPase [Roseobacter sp. S98]|uniref:AAA family ATPase n=1 Tax=Roseobacter algicola (ex Choi et al. 2025) (nom. illeg.) TaxID=3092138 RepID=UPI003F514BD7